MSLSIMVLVLFAAFLHASWNFFVKKSTDKYVGMSSIVLGHAPFALVAIVFSPTPNTNSFPFLILGVCLHLGYQLFLLNSYKTGDFTQVYPLARGIAPLIVACISITVLGRHLSESELSAIFIIGIGIMSLTLVRRSDGLRNTKAAVLALMTGGFIASYSLIDGIGAREAGTAVGFYGWLSLINAFFYAVIIRALRPGTLSAVVKLNWRLLIAGGGASFLAYALVTYSFTKAPIAIVTALRETSIIFALLLGVFVLKERVDLNKVIATMLTILGVVILRINR